MDTRSKTKIQVCFVSDKDVQNIIVQRDTKICKEDIKTQGRRHSTSLGQEVTPKKCIVSQSDDLELYNTLVEEPDIEENLCSSNKPYALFGNGDVLGHQIFGFQTPKRRNAMAQKATDSASNTPRSIDKNVNINTPKRNGSACMTKGNSINHTPINTPNGNEVSRMHSQTPKVKRDNTICEIAKTPYNLRKKIKKKISQAVFGADTSSEDEIQDLSANESDWEWTKEVENSNSEQDQSSENEDEESIPYKAKSNHNPALWATQLKGCNHTRPKKLDFVVAPEEYFTSHASSKVSTSNRTLSHLRTPRLPQNMLQQLLAHVHPSHEKAVEALAVHHGKMFPRWQFILREGFNILLYGLGSKRSLLNTFYGQLRDDPVLVVNGFFPSLTIQQIVDSITEDILDIRSAPSDLFESVDLIRTTFSKSCNIRLYLIIHNIDGPMLRNDKSQEVLSILASIANIHLLASVDHINTPLLWDQAKLGLFNFSWWDVTSFLPYSAETSFESSLLVQHSGNLALSSLQNVFRSLTTNARSIFLLMAQVQLQKHSSKYAGMPFRDLYSFSREALLVSSDLALRSQLTEFLDHQLVKSKRGTDGSELLVIPIDASILRQFVEQQDEAS